MGCSKLRKDDCIANSNCKWIIGKGCRVSSTSASTPITPVSPPKPSPMVIKTPNISLVSRETMQQLARQIHPDLKLSPKFCAIANAHLLRFTKFILRGMKKLFEIKDLKSNMNHEKFPEICRHFINQGDKALTRPTKPLIYSSSFVRKVEESYKKKFTSEAAIFLAGGLEYLFDELVELSGNVASELGRVTITDNHVEEALRSDQELLALARTR